MDKANHIQMIVDNRIIEVGISHDIIIGVYKLRNSHKEFTYQITDKAQIRILLIDFTESGERDFTFYRNPGADMMLTREEVNEEIINSSRLFHFGTLSMTHEKVREATKHALEIAKDNNLLISFDPNIRETLWNSMEEAARQVAYGLEYCDILKISDNQEIPLVDAA